MGGWETFLHRGRRQEEVGAGVGCKGNSQKAVEGNARCKQAVFEALLRRGRRKDKVGRGVGLG